MLIWGILPLYLHAQTNTVELKAVDAENRSVVESATVQWKPIGTANQRWSFYESAWCGSYINERKKRMWFWFDTLDMKRVQTR